MSGIRFVARGAVASVCALAAFGPLVGVAFAQEATDVPPDSTTTTVAEEPPVTPPPTVPGQPPPTVGPTTTTAPPPTTTPTTRPTTTNPPPPTNPPPTPTTRPATTPTTNRPSRPAPVILFPTKRDGVVSSSTSAPGTVAAAEPKTAVKTVPAAGGDGTTTTSEAQVQGKTQERGTSTGNLASSSFEDTSSSLLPSSTLGAVFLVALVGFLAAGAYCTWLLVFARR
jgi:hypothetical protein